MNLSLNSKTLLFAPFSASSIHKWIQKSEIGRSWRPEFSSGLRPASKQPLLENRGDADGWKGWDASEAQNQFLSSLVYKAASWPTYSSMSCEAALKSAKKSIKNQNFGIKG